MTAYSPQYASGSPAYVGDATNVVGKRIGAWFIDLFIYLILGFLIAAAFGGNNEIKSNSDFSSGTAAAQYCRLWEDNNKGFCWHTGDESEGAVFTYDGNASGAIFWVVHLIGYGVLSGVLGGSLGKRAVGLRVVTADGQLAGIGKNLLRTVLWIADAVTCAIPIVGGIMLVSTKGHRRLGDMAAGTFVVDASSVGQPVQVPGLTTGYGTGGYAPTYGAPAGWGTAAPAPAPGSWTAPATGQTPGQAPVGGAAPSAAGAASGSGPTWDDARKAYIQYDHDLQAWMQWDDALKDWKPITT